MSNVHLLAVAASLSLAMSGCRTGSDTTEGVATAPASVSAPAPTAMASPAVVSPELEDALAEALDDERHAIAFYEAVMARYGRRRPFSNIVNAERRHANALLAQYRRLGLTVPADRWMEATIEVPDSFRAACAASVDAEVRNVAIYDRLLAVARDPDLGDPAVLNVFERLRWASQERHLPAFKRCSG